MRVRPGAGRTRVGGRYEGPHGPALIVAVGAPAVDGRATEAVRQALAGALGVKSRDVVLKIGPTSRDKVFTVSGDVAERLAALLDELTGEKLATLHGGAGSGDAQKQSAAPRGGAGHGDAGKRSAGVRDEPAGQRLASRQGVAGPGNRSATPHDVSRDVGERSAAQRDGNA